MLQDLTQPPGTCANKVYGGPFKLSSGSHAIYYYSVDNVGNQEAVEVSSISVLTTPAYPSNAWAAYRHDPQHTGAISGIGPAIPVSTWSVAGFNSVFIVGPDGTSYGEQGIQTQNFIAINSDGSRKWSYSGQSLGIQQYDAGGFDSPALSTSGVVYVPVCGNGFSSIIALDNTGTLSWQFKDAGDCTTPRLRSPVVGVDGTIYAVNRVNNTLYALTSSGSVEWKFLLPVASGTLSENPVALGRDGTIYLPAESPGRLFALSSSGVVKWTSSIAGQGTAFVPVIRPDGSIVLGSDGYMQAFSSGTGNPLWTFNASAIDSNAPYAYSTPSVGKDGSLYFTTFQHLIALNPDGSLKWNVTFSGDRFEAGDMPAVDNNGTIFVASSFGAGNGSLYAYNPDGSRAWTALAGADGFSSIVMGEDGSIFANGVSLWKVVSKPFPASIAASASPNPVISGQSTIVSAAVLDASNNPLSGVVVRFSIASGSGTFASTSAITDVNGVASSSYTTSILGLNETVQVAISSLSATTSISKIYAGPALGWSSYLHDAQHTGRSPGSGPTAPLASWAVPGLGEDPIVGPDGTVYGEQGFQAQSVVAIGSDGVTKWKYTSPTWLEYSAGGFDSPALSANGMLYIPACGNSSSAILALNQSGQLQWQYQDAGSCTYPRLRSPVVAANGDIYAVNEASNDIVALSPYGSVVWKFNLGPNSGTLSGSPVAIGPDGTIYAAAEGPGRLLAIGSNGTLKWTSSIAGQTTAFVPAIRPDGSLILGSDSYVQAFNASTGGALWTFDASSIESTAGSSYITPAVGPDGSVYFTTQQHLIALNPAGALKWSIPFNDRFVAGDMPAVDSSGNVYLATSLGPGAVGNGALYAYSSNGSQLWTALSQADSFSRLVMGDDGVIYANGQELWKVASATFTRSSDGVVSLESNQTGLTIVAQSTATPVVAFALASATANGLQLVSNVYQITHSTFTPPAQIAFAFSPAVVTDTSTLAIYRFDGVSWSSTAATGITGQTVIDTGTTTEVTASIAYASLWALFTKPNDVLPPRTTLSIGLPRAGGNPTYISTATLISLAAVDDRSTIGDGLGSGVAQTLVAIDSGAFSAYSGAFTLTAGGAHTISFHSIDVIGNAEAIRSNTVYVDTAPPSLSLTPMPGVEINTATPTITALYSDTASGVDGGSMRLTLDGVDVTTQSIVTTSSAVFVPSVALVQGTHTVTATVADNIGNSTLVTSSFGIETLPPVTTLIVGAPHYGTSPLYVTTATSFGFSVSQIAQTSYSIDGGTFTVFVGTFTIGAAGTHALRYYSVDQAGITEQVRLSTVNIDDLSPRTTLSAGLPSVSSGTLIYGSAQTPFGLIAVDDLAILGDGAGSGVAQGLVAVDTSVFSAYAGTFSFAAEGLHGASFYSIDQLGQAEVVHNNQIAIDLTPPITQLQVIAVSANIAGTLDISTASLLALFATDPVSNGVASGVGQTFYVVDNDPTSAACQAVPEDPTQPAGTCANEAYAGPFALSPGFHTVYYFSSDGVDNTEVVNFTTITVDGLPPRTNLAIGSPQFGSSPIYVSSATLLSLKAVDDLAIVNDGLGLGVAATYLSLNSTPFALYPGTFTLSIQGANAVQFYSMDVIGNAEAPHVTSVYLDAAAPVTRLLIDGQPASATTIALVSSDTLALAASDAGSGVAQSLLSVDGASQQSYAAPFMLALGTHTLTFQSRDNVGNMESLNSMFATVRSSVTTPPGLTLVPVNGSTLTTATPFIAASYSNSGEGIDLSTLHLVLDGQDVTTHAAVTASSASFTPSSAMTQGNHTVTASVSDYVGNVATAAASFVIDSLPPATTLLVDGLSTSATNLVLITTDTIGFSAMDSGVGVAQTVYSLDGAAQSLYSSPFTLSAGTHTLAFQSSDKAGNTETLKTVYAQVRVFDVTPPALALSPVNGSTITTTTPYISAVYSDTGTGINLASFRLNVDGVDVTAQSIVTGSSATFTPNTALTQGAHAISASIADGAGNATASSSRFFLDSIPPVTTLQIDGAPATSANLVLIATDAISFVAVDSGTGVAQTRYSLDGGAESAYAVPFSLPAGSHALSYHSVDYAGNLEAVKTVSINVKPYDATPPVLALSPASGVVVTTTAPQIAAVYSDSGTGVNLSSFHLSLDGTDVTSQSVVTASSATFTPNTALAQGNHTVVAAIADNAGNVAHANAAWLVDSLPPITQPLVDGQAISASSVAVTSTDTFSFAATDSGTGVSQTRYSIDGGVQQVYILPFSLAIGSHTLAYQSVDNAGNLESLKVLFAAVRSTGSSLAPPTVAILSPAGQGFCLVVKRTVPILASAQGAGLQSWELDYAPGQNAMAGFVLIASGTVTLSSSTPIIWNTSALQGWQTLRVTAINAAGQSSMSQAVYVGDPSLLLSVGGALRKPQGVAIGVSGNIYVADTNNDAVAVFNPFGTPLTTYGSGDGKNAVRFNKPQGIVVDTFANMYVADTNNKRIVKFSSLGQVLLEIPGLGRPQGVALDAAGNIYASDTDNAQIKKFNSAGLLIQTINLPKSKPAGIAVDNNNRLYVADPAQNRLVILSSTGAVVMTIGPGFDFDRPYGVAVSPAGDCLVVSEWHNSRLFKFDSLGLPTLIFGREAGLEGPRGLAFDSQGELYVAERNKNRIVKLGPPPFGLPPVPLVPPSEREAEVTLLIPAKIGGRIELFDRSAIRIPPGALADDLEVSLSSPAIRLIQEEDLKKRKLDEAGLIVVSTGVQCGPEGTTLLAPATVTIPYNAKLAQSLNLSEMSLQVYAWDSDKQQWRWLPSTPNPGGHVVSAQTTQFRLYRIVGRKPQE